MTSPLIHIEEEIGEMGIDQYGTNSTVSVDPISMKTRTPTSSNYTKIRVFASECPSNYSNSIARWGKIRK